MTYFEWVQSGIGLATLLSVVVGLWKGKSLAVSIDGRIDALLRATAQSALDQDAVGEKRGRDEEIARQREKT